MTQAKARSIAVTTVARLRVLNAGLRLCGGFWGVVFH